MPADLAPTGAVRADLADLAGVTGVPPSAVRLAVLHVHDRAGAADAARAARAEEALGWSATAVPATDLRALRAAWPGAAVVVLHGPLAGLTGRLLVRGRRATVLAPPSGRWWPRLLALPLGAWERPAARWANAVVLPGERGAARWRRHWVSPFVVGDDPEAAAAVLTRAHAYGRPAAGTTTERDGGK